MRSARRRGVQLALVSLLLATAGLVTTAAPASAEPDFAPASEASIQPGATMSTEGARCTGNFIFTDGSNVYIGYAAHCASPAGTPVSTSVNGCLAESLPLGTPVRIEGATQPGTLAYSSWVTMDRVGETSTNPCLYNDFALVKIAEADEDEVNPTVPIVGGPTGLSTEGTQAGEDVFSYQGAGLLGGAGALAPTTGVSLGDTGDGWNHLVVTIPPGIPGDSGAGFLNSEGRAFGVLSTLNVLPQTGSNGVADLSRALDYMQANAPGFADVRLVEGTQPFSGGDSLLSGFLLG